MEGNVRNCNLVSDLDEVKRKLPAPTAAKLEYSIDLLRKAEYLADQYDPTDGFCPMASAKQKMKENERWPHVKRNWIKAIKAIRNGGGILQHSYLAPDNEPLRRAIFGGISPRTSHLAQVRG